MAEMATRAEWLCLYTHELHSFEKRMCLQCKPFGFH
jgi:hypothetical protein